MKERAVTFRELVEREYLAKGFVFKDVLSIVRLGTRVSDSSIRAAFAGTRVTADTAERLCQWAAATHRTTLDVLVMYRAPTKKRMWRGAGVRLAQAPANDNGGPSAALRGVSLVSMAESLCGSDGQRRIHVVLAGTADVEFEEIETALRSALGGNRG